MVDASAREIPRTFVRGIGSMAACMVHVATTTPMATILMTPAAEAKIDARTPVISVAAVTAATTIAVVAVAIAAVVDRLC